MGSSCYCDCDSHPKFYHATIRTAAKTHRCYECYMPIVPGERYEDLYALWDDRPEKVRTCPDCVELREALDTMECFCWCHGTLLEDVQTQFQEAFFPPALRFNLLRLVAEHRFRKNRRKVQ